MELKKYEVVFVDEYNIWWFVGFYDKLEDAEKDVNEYIKDYTLEDEDSEYNEFATEFGENKSLGRLQEYFSTYGNCFDRIINTPNGCIEIRGFIFE